MFHCRFIFLSNKYKSSKSLLIRPHGLSWPHLRVPHCLSCQAATILSPPWCRFGNMWKPQTPRVPLQAPSRSSLFALMASISPSTETSNLPPVFLNQAQMSPSSWFPVLRATPHCPSSVLWDQHAHSTLKAFSLWSRGLGLLRLLCEPSEVRSSSLNLYYYSFPST